MKFPGGGPPIGVLNPTDEVIEGILGKANVSIRGIKGAPTLVAYTGMQLKQLTGTVPYDYQFIFNSNSPRDTHLVLHNVLHCSKCQQGLP